MTIILFIHVSTALISVCGLVIRGLLKIKQSAWLELKWVKILPHINDSILLIAAIMLAIEYGYSPFEQPWLLAKIIGLLLYIASGMILLKYASKKPQQVLALGLCMAIFLYIASVAITKTPLIII